MRVRGAIATVVVVALLGACGGNGDEEGTKGGTPAPPPTPAQDGAADKAAAERAVLQLTDLPPGWRAEPPEPESPDDPDVARRLSECLRVDLALLEDENPASADSPDFEAPGQEEVQSSVGFVATTARAQELFSVLERPETPGCLAQAMSEVITRSLTRPQPGQQVPQGVTVGQVSVDRLSFPTIGERTVAFRAVIPVQAQGLRFPVYSDLVFALKGRAGAMTLFTDIGSPFPPEQAQQLTRTVVDRIPAS